MKFSIIIPLYNVGQYIEKCIESIANQTFADYEVVFVNDGNMMMRMGDNMAMDMDSGEIHLVFSWSDDDEDD